MRSFIIASLIGIALANSCVMVTNNEMRFTQIHVCSQNIIRVTHGDVNDVKQKESLSVNGDWDARKQEHTVTKNSTTVFVETSKVIALFDTRTGLVLITSKNGGSRMKESYFNFSKSTTKGLYKIRQHWESPTDEAIYGGGQFQNGLVNWKSIPLTLIQYNTEAIVPFFTSSSGYGILWDSYSKGHLNEPTEEIILNPSNKTIYTASVSGLYTFLIKACPGQWGCETSIAILKLTNMKSGKVLYPQYWDGLASMPTAIPGRSYLESGDYEVHLNSTNMRNTKSTLFVNPPTFNELTISSEASLISDYYYIAKTTQTGSGFDSIIAGYREATGAAKLYSKKTYGFWQCKNHYHNQSELLNAADKFRKMLIPVDNIVQDWMYWGTLGWGPHWDYTLYPNPKQMVEKLHQNNFNFMVSVWSKFANTTDYYKNMSRDNQLIPNTTYYDPYNPSARTTFYDYSNEGHFKIGVDSLWLDATEPEGLIQMNNSIYLGSGNQFANPYSLMATTAISEGLRNDYKTSQGRRVFSLTRSSFLGQQRTGATLWSGDTSSSWDTLRRQITASVNYQLTGIPYWSQDIGGFSRPPGQYVSQDYHEMMTRWFQFGVFTPIFRVHGSADTELWNYGQAMPWVINSAINLRYRLLPYIYSGFHKVETTGYTMQRHLSFDYWESDHNNIKDLGDQFMFGSQLLSAPIYTPGINATRLVWLPSSAETWTDFNTGKQLKGSNNYNVTVGIEETPIFVKCGVLVLGPVVQHAHEAADPLEIRIYDVDNCQSNSFTLFEDDGVSDTSDQSYQFSEITFSFNPNDRSLTVGSRQGSFPGMLSQRVINAVVVRSNTGVGVAPSIPDKIALYNGEKLIIRNLPKRD